MELSKLTILILAFIFFLILYYSLHLIINYYYEDGLIYIKMYATYYIFFFILLFIAISLNYYINTINIPSQYSNLQ
jgi:hypothetical protein